MSYTISTQNGPVVIKAFADLEQVPTGDILRAYNQLTGKTTKKFKTRTVGMERFFKVLQSNDEELIAANGAEAETEKPKKVRGERAMIFNFPVGKDGIKKHRENTKRATAIGLLLEGATFEAVQKATGWNRKDAYEGIRLLHYYVGYGIKTDETTGIIKLFTS